MAPQGSVHRVDGLRVNIGQFGPQAGRHGHDAGAKLAKGVCPCAFHFGRLHQFAAQLRVLDGLRVRLFLGKSRPFGGEGRGLIPGAPACGHAAKVLDIGAGGGGQVVSVV